LSTIWNRVIALAALSLISGADVVAQPVAATQKLALEVLPVTRIVVSGSPLPMSVAGGTASGSVTDGSSSYSLVTNLSNMRIAASIDRPMPSGTSLAITLESSRGTSRGEVDITRSTGATDVVAGVGPGSESGQKIRYRFSTEPGMSELAPQERTVTLTLTE
jgi:hypothetical protein